ncbi:MAG: hypothetical protein FWD57_05890 [Polyangiaceae bacterium]|nr:hypothetical protein [Polyangiaceae bacterium]
MEQPPSVEEIADTIYQVIARAQGLKRLTPGDLIRSVELAYGDRAETLDKKACKAAIRSLIDSGRCIYTYFGSTTIELPQ